jgi:dipeptidyl aminopeptidase/acylaminoacyl peptidase
MLRTAAPTLLLLLSVGAAGAQTTYQKPPKAIADVLDAPAQPQPLLSPTGRHVLLVEAARYPGIADLSEPMLRLAGLRVSPATHGPHAPPRVVGLTVLDVNGGKQTRVEVPDGSRLGMPVWSPDGKRFAFTRTTADAIELWTADVATAKAARVPGVRLNAVLGAPFHWMPDGKTLVCKVVVPDRKPPEAPRVPTGPVIQESDGKKAPARTHQDLLQTDHDEALFEFYATSRIALVDAADPKTVRPLGEPALFSAVSPSPDGKRLLVTEIKRPFSRLLTWTAFPHDVLVWEVTGPGEPVPSKKVAGLPLADKVPIDGVPTGPRGVHWLPTEPATLVWAEALDGGDPKTKADFRDEVRTLRVSAEDKPRTLARTQHRFAGLSFADTGAFALLSDLDRDRKRRRTFLIDPARPDGEHKLLWDLSVNERYKHPGTPLTRTLPGGQTALRTSDGKLFLHGQGATPEGDRPFLDRFDPKTGKAERLFRCEEGCYETPVALLDDDGSRFLTRRETPAEPPNLYVRTASGKEALTRFTDPTPQLRGIKKRLVTYKRADGVPLSFTLYLPPDHKEGQRLPALVWAYPREYTDPDTAGQVGGSPYHFTTLSGPSHLFLVLHGYAVLDNVAMPIVGDAEKVNDTFVEQLVADAKAAIDKADEMGVIDRRRVAVGGHSYGAFMTANLLAHSDLFKAGVARSGAYNRTLTPFGFQSERRTLWEAPDVYLKMSPFLYADRIKAPLLLIHGAADNNDGTFPIQSERLYQAVRGHGGTVRYVSLPHGAHGYAARESVGHTLYEMAAWLDKHVKDAP